MWNTASLSHTPLLSLCSSFLISFFFLFFFTKRGSASTTPIRSETFQRVIILHITGPNSYRTASPGSNVHGQILDGFSLKYISLSRNTLFLGIFSLSDGTSFSPRARSLKLRHGAAFSPVLFRRSCPLKKQLYGVSIEGWFRVNSPRRNVGVCFDRSRKSKAILIDRRCARNFESFLSRSNKINTDDESEQPDLPRIEIRR